MSSTLLLQPMKPFHPQAQTHVHELPDRPLPYQGPPALERRESNRSRHEVCLGPVFVVEHLLTLRSMSLNSLRTVEALITREQKAILKGAERGG